MQLEEPSKGSESKHEEMPQRPSPLLTDEEIEAGDKAFVEHVKARDKMIAEAKKAKGILDDDH